MASVLVNENYVAKGANLFEKNQTLIIKVKIIV